MMVWKKQNNERWNSEWRMIMTNQSVVKTLPNRSEISEELTWRLEDIYATDEMWEKEYKDIKESLTHTNALKGQLSESPEKMLEVLQYQANVSEKMGKLY